jgi:hypothetical protein
MEQRAESLRSPQTVYVICFLVSCAVPFILLSEGTAIGVWQAGGAMAKTRVDPGDGPLVAAYRINGEIPNGAPGDEDAPALQSALDRTEALKCALEVVATAIDSRTEYDTGLRAECFHQAIRVYRPEDKFASDGKPCRITRMDEKMYACRVAHRLLNAVGGKCVKLPGDYRSHRATDARAQALLRAIVAAASRLNVDLPGSMRSH